MVPQPLLEYLKKCKSDAIDFAAIEQELAQQGWNEKDVEEARNWYLGFKTTIPSSVRGSRRKPLFFISLFIILLLLIVTGTASVLVAYEKIPLTNSTFKQKLSDFIIGLPFAPKTPRYVLNASADAHKNLRQINMDISLAVSAQGLSNALGLNSLDTALKGPVDFVDPKNPEFSVNIAIAKQFNADIRMKDKIAYFKLNKLPAFIPLFLGIEEEQLSPILNTWVSYDTSHLETEARKNLEQLSEKKSVEDKKLEEKIRQFVDKEIMPQIEMSEEELDGFQTYKIHLTATKELLDKIVSEFSKERYLNPSMRNEELSDVIQNLTIDSWIDQSSYYTRKTVIAFTIKPNNRSDVLSSFTDAAPFSGLGLLEKSLDDSIDIAFVIKLSDFNQPLTVEVPQDAISIEEMMKRIMDLSQSPSYLSPSSSPSASPYSTPSRTPPPASSLFNPATQFAKARNVHRQSDLLQLTKALHLYAVDNNGKFPATISSTPTDAGTDGLNLAAYLADYLFEIPQDLSIGTAEKTHYLISLEDGEITATASAAELGEIISETR